ncbi:hypothetical protein LCGC14_1000450 [marine sediment metagenome]|uniref:Uncharacterized protein n=1 Tax=marine sediment metagenome TaxID=412755 RepID=A0A0F9QLJ9_9ZZZZ
MGDLSRIEKAIENHIYQGELLNLLWDNRQLIDGEWRDNRFYNSRTNIR